LTFRSDFENAGAVFSEDQFLNKNTLLTLYLNFIVRDVEDDEEFLA